MPAQADSTEYARRLAAALAEAAAHRHVVRDLAWRDGAGRFVFDVELCDSDDLPAGYSARVVISVSRP